jgi:alanine racemase
MVPTPVRADRAWMDVDLDALVRNGTAAQQRAGVPLIPMIKADAYGLGAERVALALEQLQPFGYGIATIEEARLLRSIGISRPLIVFTPLLRDEYLEAHALALRPTLGFPEEIEEWRKRAGNWHLSIDTGMSRAGIPWREVDRLNDVLTRHMPEGAFTHFHSAELNDGSMDEQENRFREAVLKLPHRPRILHTDGSAAIARHGRSEWDAIRPGVFLYGVGSGEGAQLEPEPVVYLHARIAETRWIEPNDTVSYDATWRADSRRRIATLPVGYADGYPRALSNRGKVLVRDRFVPIVGLVTMDMIMIDVTDIDCEPGDVVTLIGREPQIRLGTLGELAQMSYYEILTGLRSRLTRYYIHA